MARADLRAGAIAVTIKSAPWTQSPAAQISFCRLVSPSCSELTQIVPHLVDLRFSAEAVRPLSCRQLPMSFGDREFWPEQFEHYPVFFPVHESKDMGAAFTEPEMLHSVEAS